MTERKLGDALPNDSRFIAALHARGIAEMSVARKGKMNVYRALSTDNLLALEIAGDLQRPRGVTVLAAMPPDNMDVVKNNTAVMIELMLLMGVLSNPGTWFASQVTRFRSATKDTEREAVVNAPGCRVKLAWMPNTSMLVLTIAIKEAVYAHADAATA